MLNISACSNDTSEPWADEQTPYSRRQQGFQAQPFLQGNGVISHPGHGYP